MQHELTFRKTWEFRKKLASQTTTFFSMFFFVQNSDQLEMIGYVFLDLQAL